MERREPSFEKEQNGFEVSGPIINSSEFYDVTETYKITGNVEGIHMNEPHMQDAFSIQEKNGIMCVTVCDGVSSREGSGILSSMLCERISEMGLSAQLADLINENELEKILAHIAEDAGGVEGGGSSTMVSARFDSVNKTVEWSSIGDSPLFVVDKDDEGNMSWAILTEEGEINNKNYRDSGVLEDLQDPVTQSLGIGANDELKVPSQRHIKHGFIEYKEGRRVVLASDFLTKMILFSPDAVKIKEAHAKERRKDELAKLWATLAQKNEADFPDVWVTNPASGEQMINPTFMEGLGQEQLKELPERWMIKNNKGSDDVTILSIDLDHYFNPDSQ